MSNKPDDKDDNITMTFTRHAWRVMAIACQQVPPGIYKNKSDERFARLLSGVIVRNLIREEKK